MSSGWVILTIILIIVNLCATAVSVVFAIQSSLAMRKIERQRRMTKGHK